jgi:hypothetical protein
MAVSADHIPMAVSADHIPMAVSADHIPMAVSANHIPMAVSANHIKAIGLSYSDPARFRAVGSTCRPTLTGQPERLFLRAP